MDGINENSGDASIKMVGHRHGSHCQVVLPLCIGLEAGDCCCFTSSFVASAIQTPVGLMMFHIVSSLNIFPCYCLGIESGDLFNNCTSLLLKVWDGFIGDLLMLPFHQKTCDDLKVIIPALAPSCDGGYTNCSDSRCQVSWFDLSSVYLRMSFNIFLRWVGFKIYCKHLLEASKFTSQGYQVICSLRNSSTMQPGVLSKSKIPSTWEAKKPGCSSTS